MSGEGAGLEEMEGALLADREAPASGLEEPQILEKDFVQAVGKEMSRRLILGIEKPGAERASDQTGLEEAPQAQHRVLAGHEDKVFDVAVSPDGRIIASVGADAVARLWDPATGRVLRVLRDPAVVRESLVRVKFSQDGRLLATVGDNRMIRIWNAESGALVSSFRPEIRPSRARAKVVIEAHFLPDGRLAAVVSDETRLTLWDVTSQSLIRVLRDFTPRDTVGGVDSVQSAAFSPDGKLLATGSEGLQLWDLEGAEPLTRSWKTGETVRAVAFSPDGGWIATGGEGRQAKIWDPQREEPVRTFPGHARAVVALAFSPDGTWLASGGEDNGILVNALERDALALKLSGHESAISALSPFPGGMGLVSSSLDRTLRIWGPGADALINRLDSVAVDVPREAAVMLRLLGARGGQAVRDRLMAMLPTCPEVIRQEMLVAALAASTQPQEQAPLGSEHWSAILQSIRQLIPEEEGEFPQEEWLVRLEGVYMEALSLEGPPLDVSVFRESGGELLAAIGGYPPVDERERMEGFLGRLNPKDQLAHLLWSLSMRARFQGETFVAQELSAWPLQRGMPYPDLYRVYELVHRYPQAARAALSQAGSRIQSLSRGRKLGYWEAFERWLVRLALMAAPFERMGMRDRFLQEFSPLKWHGTPEALAASMQALDREIAYSAQAILRTSFDPERIPFIDSSRFSERDRDRFLLSLLYQADHQGEPLRSALAPYFKVLEARSYDWEGAAQAAESALVTATRERNGTVPPDSFRNGPGTFEFVAQPVKPRGGKGGDIPGMWLQAVGALASIHAMSGLPPEVADEVGLARGEMERSGPPAGIPELQAAQVRLRAVVQRAWDQAGPNQELKSALLPHIRTANQAMQHVVNLAAQRREQARPRLVRLRLEKDPVRKLAFSYPSRLCLDFATGIHRASTQYYVTNLNHQIIVAEELENPNVDPPLARLTVGRATDGSIVATNPLSQPADYDFVPAFVEYLELYATVSQAPAVLPVRSENGGLSLFPGPFGKGWRKARMDLVFPAGADAGFHMDLADIARLPNTVRGIEAWVYTPPADPASVMLRGARSAGRMNLLLRMMDSFLRAQQPTEVEAAFLEAVRSIMGFSGVVLYRMDPKTRKIRSTIRALENPSRYSDWADPEGEHLVAMERSLNGENSLHIRNRFDLEEAPYVDPELLEMDRRRYPAGDVREVFYVVLEDRQGLVMVTKWASGDPLFPGVKPGSPEEEEYKTAVRGLLQTLGNGALLAMETAESTEHLSGFMDLTQRGGEVAARLEQVTKDMRSLATQAGTAAQDAPDLEKLGAQLKETAVRLEAWARQAMDVVRRRRAYGRQTPRDTLPHPAPVIKLSALEGMFGDLSISLLNAVLESSSSAVERVRENFLLDHEYPPGSVEREIVERWLELASSAIEARHQWEQENRTLPVFLENLRAQLPVMEQQREQVQQILASNSLSSDATQQAHLVLGEIEQASQGLSQFLSRLGGSQPDSQAGLEEIADVEAMSVEDFRRLHQSVIVDPSVEIPSGASRAWVVSGVANVYGQGAAMAAGLEERFRQAIPGVQVRVRQAPLPAGQRYNRPGVLVQDAALGTALENPRQLVVLTLWLSDLERIHPASLILAALGALERADMEILGAQVFQDAQGRAMLVIFA